MPHVISTHDLLSLVQLAELSQLSISLGFHWKLNFLECQIIVLLLCDVTRDFVISRWASPPESI